mgnify:CR=1 FL=1
MQIIINAPDDIPAAIIEQQVEAFESRLKALSYPPQKQSDKLFKIDKQACLDALAQVKRGDKTGMTEIGDIDQYIEQLKHEIS